MFRIPPLRRTAGTIRNGLLALLFVCGLIALPTRPAAAGGVTASVQPEGSGLHFSAVSSVPVDWEIQLSTGPIEFTPFPPHFPTGGVLRPRVFRLSSNGAALTTFAPAKYQLLPGTVYNYIVRGGSTYATGAVRTFGSKVTVVFNRVDIIDDSDTGAGELTFHFNAGDGFFQQVGELALTSPTSLPMPIIGRGAPGITSITRNKVGPLQLQVEGVDDDVDAPFEACRNGQPPDGTSGSDNCFDWATAAFSSDVAQLAGLSSNNTTKVVTFETTSFRLKFRVSATVTVQYGDVLL